MPRCGRLNVEESLVKGSEGHNNQQKHWAPSVCPEKRWFIWTNYGVSEQPWIIGLQGLKVYEEAYLGLGVLRKPLKKAWSALKP